ncbi:MAG: hypothetical protein ACFFAX_00315 [Promethearchaeota archaeon]
MTKSIENGNHHIEQLMRLGVELLNIPSTASSVLAALYKQRCNNEVPLSMKAISELTGLSVTTVSSLCTILESLGVLDRQSHFGSTGRGRRKILFSMRMGLNSFLSHSFRKHLKEIDRIYNEMKQANSRLKISTEEKIVRTKAISEAKQFLADYLKFAEEKGNSTLTGEHEGSYEGVGGELDQNLLDSTEEH